MPCRTKRSLAQRRAHQAKRDKIAALKLVSEPRPTPTLPQASALESLEHPHQQQQQWPISEPPKIEDDRTPLIATVASSDHKEEEGSFVGAGREPLKIKIDLQFPNQVRNTGSKLHCTQCPAFFLTEENLYHHENKHNGVRSVSCRMEGCSKKYFSVQGRKRHEAICGKERQQFVCTTCAAVLHTKDSHRSHMARHEDPKFGCEICGKAFFDKRSLVKHGPVHTGERNYECTVCGKRFKSKEANRVHQRIHTQEKPYVCQVCAQSYAHNCSLKAHMLRGH